MTATGSSNAARESASLSTADSTHCLTVHLPPAMEATSSGTYSILAAAAPPTSSSNSRSWTSSAAVGEVTSSSRPEYSMVQKFGEKWSPSYVAPSVERQRIATSDACNISATVTAAGSETAASAFTSPEKGYNHHNAGAVVSCLSTFSPGAARHTGPGFHVAAAAAHVAADAYPAAAVAASSLAVSGGGSVTKPQLQSLSAFSRSVGISEFVLCDCFTTSSTVGKQAAPGGENAAAAVGRAAVAGRAAETAKLRALKGSLKTLFEDFQVYEHSLFPCICRNAQRSCRICGSSDDSSGACCSSKADSNCSNTSHSGRLSASNQVQSNSDGGSLKGNSLKEEKVTDVSRRNAARDKGVLEPCAYGCWCKAFGGEKPLRLPYLVLPSDVLRQKQQRLALESGAAHISTSFRLKSSEAFLPPHVSDCVECSSSSSIEMLTSGRGTTSTIEAGSPGACLALPSAGSSGSSSSGDDVERISKKCIQHGMMISGEFCRKHECLRASHNTKGRCCCCRTAVAVATAERTPAAAGLTVKDVEWSCCEGCPFSPLEIQNVDAFVRFLAMSSALYRHRRDVTKAKLQETAQQEAGAVLHEQQDQQKRETIRQRGIQQQGCDPTQQQDSLREIVSQRRDIFNKKDARELEMDSPSKRARQVSLAEESEISECHAFVEGGCSSCWRATATADPVAKGRWEAAAARIAAEAEEAAVAAADVFFAGNRSSSSLTQEACDSRTFQTAIGENPFFEPGTVHQAAEPAADSLSQQIKEEREEPEIEQQRRQQPNARGGRRMKGQRQSSREASFDSLTQHLQERPRRESERHDEQQKRRQMRQDEKGVLPPVLWVLGDWVSFICRHMIEGEGAPDAATTVSVETADLRMEVSLSTMAGEKFNSPPFECREAVAECAAARALSIFSESDSVATPSVASAGVAGERVGVRNAFAVAVAACVERSAPSLKDLRKAVRTSMHDFARKNLPFFCADTLPLAFFLRNEQQHYELQSRKQQQEEMVQQKQVQASEQHEERRTIREGEHEKDVSDVHETEQDRQRKQLQGEEVCMEEMKQRYWGLLRMYAPPGALQCVGVQPFATTAATARRAATTAAQGEVRDTLMEGIAAHGNSVEASDGSDKLSVEHSGVSDHACGSEIGEEEQQQFLKYFVSLAACVAQQCQALQQLLTLLHHQQQQMQMCLRQAEQPQLQRDPRHEERDQQRWQKSQRLLVQLGRCGEWINLVTSALAALTDEKEQPQLMLMRLTPLPICLRYLFPRKDKELPEEPQQQSFCADFRSSEGMSFDTTSASVDGPSATGLGTRNSGLCCWSQNQRDEPGDFAKTSLGWRLPVHLRQGIPTAPFLHFVLLKINRETAAAMRNLEQQLRHQRLTSSSSTSWAADDGRRRGGRSAVNAIPVTVAAAGTKDKRGVTVQRCSVSKVSANALLEACYLGQQQRQRFQRTQLQQQFQQPQQPVQAEPLRIMKLQHRGAEVVHEEPRRYLYPPEEEQLPTMFIAPLGYYSEPQWLGGLRGNFFQVIIRNLRPAPAAPASACEGIPPPQTSSAEETINACLLGGSVAAGAVIPPTQTEQVSTGGGKRGIETQGESAVARLVAAISAETEEARAGRDATSQTSLPSPFIRATAQAAENSQYPRSIECSSPHMGAEEQKRSQARRRAPTISSPSLFVPLSECEKDVQQLGEAVSSSMSSFRSLGFLNYYGLQRFGTHTVRTYEVGAAVLRGDWAAAVAGILGGKMPVHLGETAKDADARHFEATATSERAAMPSSTECATGCEAATAGVADDFQSATTQHLAVGPGKQHGGHRATFKSPWELLLEEGPAAALNSLAKHQHIERVVLSTLLQHSRTQQTTDAQQSALKKRQRSSSSSSSSIDNSRLCCVSATSSSCSVSFSVSNTLSTPTATASSVASSSPHESMLPSETVSASSSMVPDVPSSLGCPTPHAMQQKSSWMPADQRDFATPQKAVESPTIRKATTEVHAREQPTVKHKQRLQSCALEQQGRKQGNGCASSLQVRTVLSDTQAAPMAQLQSSSAANYGYVRLARGSPALADNTSAAAADTVVAVAEATAIEAPAGSPRPASITQASRYPRAFRFQGNHSISPAVYFRALLKVAPASLQLYVHAAQSVLFNFACSWRWRLYGPRVRVGDFVYNRTGCRSRSTDMSPWALSSDDGRFVDSWEATLAAGSSGQHKASGAEAHSCVQAGDVGSLDANCSSFASSDKEIQSQVKAVGSITDGTQAQPHFRQKLPYDFSAASADRCDRREDVHQVSRCSDGEKGENCSSRQYETVEAHRHRESIRKITTEEEACNASIHDVVLPLAGTDVEYPADLLTVYRQLSREILGVEFEAFQRFNTIATKRKCFNRQLRRQRGHEKRMRSIAGRQTNYTMDRKGNSCDSRSQRNVNTNNSPGSTTAIYKRSSHCSNKNCTHIKERSLGKRKDEQEPQQGDADLQTADGCCETERDAESARLCTGLLNSSVRACASAEAEENMDLRNLGISCKGGFRPLLVRPRQCSWQLLRVGDDPDAEPKPLLLNDVDLLLRGRHSVGRAEEYSDRMFMNRKSVQQQRFEVAQDEFRVSFDEELLSDVVRCIPGEQKRIEPIVRDDVISTCSSAAEGLAESAGPECESEKVYVVGTVSHASSSVDDSRRLDEDSLGAEMRKHACRHQENARTQRTNLMVHCERSNFCLLLRFWLPSGCYFTMALREIMRANAPDDDGAAFAGARCRNATAD